MATWKYLPINIWVCISGFSFQCKFQKAFRNSEIALVFRLHMSLNSFHTPYESSILTPLPHCVWEKGRKCPKKRSLVSWFYDFFSSVFYFFDEILLMIVIWHAFEKCALIVNLQQTISLFLHVFFGSLCVWALSDKRGSVSSETFYNLG